MKAKGKLNSLITLWNTELLEEYEPCLKVIACVGTKRVRYLTEENEWTTEEKKAVRIRQGKSSKFWKQVPLILFPYCRVVLVNSKNRLPTVNGR